MCNNAVYHMMCVMRCGRTSPSATAWGNFKHEAFFPYLFRWTFWMPMGAGCWFLCQIFWHWQALCSGHARGHLCVT